MLRTKVGEEERVVAEPDFRPSPSTRHTVIFYEVDGFGIGALIVSDLLDRLTFLTSAPQLEAIEILYALPEGTSMDDGDFRRAATGAIRQVHGFGGRIIVDRVEERDRYRHFASVELSELPGWTDVVRSACQAEPGSGLRLLE